MERVKKRGAVRSALPGSGSSDWACLKAKHSFHITKPWASAEWPIWLTLPCCIIFSKETTQFGPQNTIKFYVSSHCLSCLLSSSKYFAKSQNPNRTANEPKADFILPIPFHIKLLIYLILSFISLPFHWNSPCPTQSAGIVLHVSLSAAVRAGRTRTQTQSKSGDKASRVNSFLSPSSMFPSGQVILVMFIN